MTIHLLYFHANRGGKKTLWKDGGLIRCCLRRSSSAGVG
nr:acetyl-CoA carboxyltransferase beta subunit [Solanum turneroides]UNZ87053.1 acetyl-CoA carboxyltransferase beta subunit [Solanum turneroides]